MMCLNYIHNSSNNLGRKTSLLTYRVSDLVLFLIFFLLAFQNAFQKLFGGFFHILMRFRPLFSAAGQFLTCTDKRRLILRFLACYC